MCTVHFQYMMRYDNGTLCQHLIVIKLALDACISVCNVWDQSSVYIFLRQHRGKVTGIAFNPVSPHLYSCGSVGSLALHDTQDDKYQLMRLLTNTVARGDARCPNTLTISSDGRHVAFVGPTDFTISVVDAKSLDEVHICCSTICCVLFCVLQ